MTALQELRELRNQEKAIKDAFPVSHPNIEPDEITYTVKCLD